MSALDAPARPAKKKRKKKRPLEGPAALPLHEPPPRLEDVPAFASEFPDDPELAKLVALFELGNYFAVREGVRKLVRATGSDDVRRAARELERRTEADPLAKL